MSALKDDVKGTLWHANREGFDQPVHLPSVVSLPFSHITFLNLIKSLKWKVKTGQFVQQVAAQADVSIHSMPMV